MTAPEEEPWFIVLGVFFFLFFLSPKTQTQTQSALDNVVSKHGRGQFALQRRRVVGFSNRASADLSGVHGQGRLILLIASQGGRTWAVCRNQRWRLRE